MKLSEEDIKQRHDIADAMFALIEGKRNKNIAPTVLGVYTLMMWKGGYDKKTTLSAAADFIERWYADQEKGVQE